MRTRPLLFTATLLILAGVPLRAQETPPAPGTPRAPEAAPEAPSEDTKVVVGEITELAERSFRIRPWNPNLPRRLQVIAGSETRYFRQTRGKRKELAPGELVMVISERASAPRKTTDDDSGAAAAPAAPAVSTPPPPPARAKAILRLWNAEGKETTPEDRAVGLCLLRGAIPFFPGRGASVNERMERDFNKALGVVKSVEPLSVETMIGTRQFQTEGDTLVVAHEVIKPESLKKGQTVVVRSLTGPTADGTLQATVIALSPEPRLTPKQQRRMILRERGQLKGKK